MHSRARQVIVHHPNDPNGAAAEGEASHHGRLCNVVLKVIVDMTEREYFEEHWHLDIYESMSTWKGFLYRSTNIINVANGKIEYLIILGFDCLENCRAWITSDARKAHMDDAQAHGMILFYINEYGGASSDLPLAANALTEKDFTSYNLVSRNDMAKAAYIPRPPPKWKLFLIIWIGVYLAVLLSNFSGIGRIMNENGFPLYMILLISLIHSVTVLSFTLFPLVMSVPAVGRWLKAPRPEPENMNDILWFLDLGLDLFSQEVVADIGDILQRLQTLEGRLDKLKRINYDMSVELVKLNNKHSHYDATNSTEERMEEGDMHSLMNSKSDNDVKSDVVMESVHKLKEPRASKSNRTRHERDAPFLSKLKEASFSLSSKFSRKYLNNQLYISPNEVADITIKNTAGGRLSLGSGQENHPLTMSVLNRVKWECTIAYEQWIKNMVEEMARHAGFLGMTTIQVPNEDNSYINTFSFDSYEHLESFICSKERLALLKQLEGMLLGSSISDVTEEHSFHAVFDELFVSTGGAASLTHPPVWKTNVLVIMPLFFLVWCVASGLGPVLVGLDPAIAILISTAITVAVNTWIGVPIMHLVFGKWHRRHRKLINRATSRLSFLDLGLSRFWQVVFLVCYVLVLLLVGFLEL